MVTRLAEEGVACAFASHSYEAANNTSELPYQLKFFKMTPNLLILHVLVYIIYNM